MQVKITAQDLMMIRLTLFETLSISHEWGYSHTVRKFIAEKIEDILADITLVLKLEDEYVDKPTASAGSE